MKAATTRLSLLALAIALSACSTSILEGDKIDYKSAAKGSSLEVPPDLTQLSRDSRYAMPGGSVSAAAMQAGQTAQPSGNANAAALQLGDPQTAAFDQQADALVDVAERAVPMPVATAAAAPLAPAVGAGASDAELDKSILNYALLNGALELLPQSWASMAIIPLQVKMVYGIGKAHGVELDQGHIKEFIAAAGVGMTSQYLEQFGRKLMGGLLGKVAGRTLGGLGGAATGMAFSFATTYALGHAAKRYYAGGRVMSTAMLRETFQGLLTPAKQLQTQYLPQIQQKAATLDAGQIMALVRGK